MQKGFAASIFCAFFTQAVPVAGGHMAKACLQGMTGEDVRCSGTPATCAWFGCLAEISLASVENCSSLFCSIKGAAADKMPITGQELRDVFSVGADTASAASAACAANASMLKAVRCCNHGEYMLKLSCREATRLVHIKVPQAASCTKLVILTPEGMEGAGSLRCKQTALKASVQPASRFASVAKDANLCPRSTALLWKPEIK